MCACSLPRGETCRSQLLQLAEPRRKSVTATRHTRHVAKRRLEPSHHDYSTPRPLGCRCWDEDEVVTATEDVVRRIPCVHCYLSLEPRSRSLASHATCQRLTPAKLLLKHSHARPLVVGHRISSQSVACYKAPTATVSRPSWLFHYTDKISLGVLRRIDGDETAGRSL